MYDTQYWKTTEVSWKELIPESQLKTLLGQLELPCELLLDFGLASLT